MARTLTHQIPLGFIAPDFFLLNPRDGKYYRYADVRGNKGTVVVFMCNHCPFVVHILDELLAVARDFTARGIGFVFINANDVVAYPADHPDLMKTLADTHNFPCAYLFDETQEVAKAYDAACTPDFNVFDANDRCVYRGQFDAARPGNEHPVTGRDLRSALQRVVAGERPNEADQIPSMGCNIKWKPE